MQLSTEVKLTKVQNHTAAGTSAVTSDSVDMAGFEGVLFLTSFGTAAAGNTLKLQQSSDDGDQDAWSDVAGSSVTSGDSDEDVYIDVFRPTKQFVRVVAARGTSSTLESIWALQYEGSTRPVDNTIAGTIVGELHLSPAEGSA